MSYVINGLHNLCGVMSSDLWFEVTEDEAPSIFINDPIDPKM